MNHGILFNLSNFPMSQRPLGPYRIAHWLREKDWDIEVIEYALQWSLEELQEFIKSRVNSETKFIGLSHIFYAWSEDFENFLSWFKSKYPYVVVISGSAANPGFESKNIDYYIRGYGEYAILELLKYIFGSGKCPSYDLKFFGRKKVIDAIKSYPAYPMNSLMVKYEDRDFLRPTEWLGIEFSRGCKFQCAFCNYPILGVKEDYSRNAEDAKVQLQDAYDRFGISNYYISDDTFNDRTEKIKKFADVIDQLSFKPWMAAFIRADLLSSRPDDKVELARMGVNGHYYGIESFNKSSAKAIGKGMDPEKIKQGIIEAKNYFNKINNNQYRSTIGLIIGLPNETKETIAQTKQWLINNWQTQNFIAWGLEIYNPNGVENLSKISLDYKKYGYRVLTDIKKLKPEVVHSKYDLMGERFIWENDNMDFYEAQSIANDLNDLTKVYDFRNTPFDLHIDHLVNPQLSLRELINTPIKNLIDHRSVEISDHVKDYIRKKLNL